MELQELYSLMERFASSGLTELEWQKKDERVTLRRENPAVVMQTPTAVQTAAAAPIQEASAASAPQVREEDLVKAPLVGVFYAAPAPGEAPFAAPGKQMKKGETLCLIEAMKMMSEVPAPCDCIIEAVLKDNGELAAFGEPLLRYKPC